jgi:CsoR family transcriptional regulator, copper-sensing transcriptional repressor
MGADMKSAELIKRLKNIEGHLHGVVGMLENEVYCINVIQQIQAVQASLNKLNMMILDNHLHSCVTEAVRGEDAGSREKVLKEIMQLYETATKV